MIWAEAHDAVIVDVRLKPWSQQPDWRRQNLQARLGRRYLWIEQWGNLRYKDGPPVDLKDWAAGLRRFRKITAPVAVILCGCRDEETCHRSDVLTGLVDTGFRRIDLLLER